MAQQHINTGSALGAGNGESIRSAAIKMQDNFTELYDTQVGTGLSLSGLTGSLQITTESASPATDVALEVSSSYSNTSFGSYRESILFGKNELKVVKGSQVANPPGNLFRLVADNESLSSSNTRISITGNTIIPELSFRSSLDFKSSFILRRFPLSPASTLNGIVFNLEASVNDFYVYGDNGIAFYIDTTSSTQGCKVGGLGPGTNGIQFDVVGLTQSTEAATDGLSYTDPGVAGEIFAPKADTIFGTGDQFRVLCVSQG